MSTEFRAGREEDRMNIVWNERTARWFADASAYTGYHRRLAAVLLGLLPGRGTLADMGCGTGLIDMELAGHYDRVTCVDVNAEALSFLHTAAAGRGIENIETRLCDAAEVTETFDDVIAVFHGSPEAFARRYIPLAKGGFAAVVHSSPEGRLGPENYRNRRDDTAKSTVELFTKLGIEYKRTDISIEYGQPLKSMEDARDFTRAYSDSPPESAVDEYLERNLVRTGERDFPLYLPNEKTFSIFSVLK